MGGRKSSCDSDDHSLPYPQVYRRRVLTGLPKETTWDRRWVSRFPTPVSTYDRTRIMLWYVSYSHCLRAPAAASRSHCTRSSPNWQSPKLGCDDYRGLSTPPGPLHLPVRPIREPLPHVARPYVLYPVLFPVSRNGTIDPIW